MAPPRQSDAAPATPPAPDHFSQAEVTAKFQSDTWPINGFGNSTTTGSDSGSGANNAPSVFDSLRHGNYGEAWQSILNGPYLTDSTANPLGVDQLQSGMANVRANRDGLINAVGQKREGAGDSTASAHPNGEGFTSAAREGFLNNITDRLNAVDPEAAQRWGPVIKDLKDLLKKAETKPVEREKSVEFRREQRPDVAKRERFDNAMERMAHDFPESFQASQKLMQAAYDLAAGGELDTNQMRELAQESAREFAANPNSEAAKRLREISEQLKVDYGISVELGKKGLEIRNDGWGADSSLVRFDQYGNMTAMTNTAPGLRPQDASVEHAMKNISQTRIQHAFNNVRINNSKGELAPLEKDKTQRPRGPVYSGTAPPRPADD